MGTAEVESALVAHAKVAEAAVVGYPHDIKGQGIYAYVTLNAGEEPSDELRAELRQWVRKEIGLLQRLICCNGHRDCRKQDQARSCGVFCVKWLPMISPSLVILQHWLIPALSMILSTIARTAPARLNTSKRNNTNSALTLIRSGWSEQCQIQLHGRQHGYGFSLQACHAGFLDDFSR